MPYKIAHKGKGFVVEDIKGRQFSKKPLTRAQAEAQRIAIALSESRKTGRPVSFFL